MFCIFFSVSRCDNIIIDKYGITLAADMYIPKESAPRLPAIAVSGPFGAVKEQCSGLYAQTMAERGFSGGSRFPFKL